MTPEAKRLIDFYNKRIADTLACIEDVQLNNVSKTNHLWAIVARYRKLIIRIEAGISPEIEGDK
jgi:hypothetical protein